MGFSWALSGQVDVGKKLDKYRKAKVDPSRFSDWPDAWGQPTGPTGKSEAKRLEAIVGAFQKIGADVRWSARGFKLRAVVSDDDGVWVSLRSHLAAAVRSAADFDGTGEL